MWFLAYFLIHFIVYTLLRVEFLIWNWSSLKNLSFSDFCWAFLNGVRFDLSALAVTLGLCFLGLVWMGKKNKLQKLWFLFFIALNSIFLCINFVDVELYNFTAKRFTATSFYLVGEGHISNIISPYLPLVMSSLLLLFGYIFCAYKMSFQFVGVLKLKNRIILSFLIFIVSIICSRGGFQHKPLTFVDAKLFDNTYANNLVLNSTFTVLKSSTKKSMQKVHYYSNEELLAQLNPQETDSINIQNSKINIVIVILESFSQEYLNLRNPEVTPHFNELITKAVSFKHGFANGRRSIEGIAAIMSGIPALMEEPFIGSEFSANQIIGLGTLLQAHDYSTSFFHGTHNGSMHFDSFTKSVGIEKHFGLNEYPNQEDHDGTWGIYDEPFLNWACQKMNEFKKPFFSSIFTLSSHQPYKLPDQYINTFKDERLPILKSIEYADYSVDQFLKCAEKQTWFKDTLFIFTADHTGPSLNENSDFKSHYEVPIVFYGPHLPWLSKINTNQYAQQIDILPTLLDILNIEQKNKNYLSRSLLRDGSKVIALYSDNHYELVGDVREPEKQLKAVQQYFSEGLYDNRLYYPVK